MQSIRVVFYDGVISKAHQAELRCIDSSQFEIHYVDAGGNITRRLHAKQMKFIGAIGQNCAVIELDQDARIEFLGHDIPAVFQLKHQALQGKIWHLERSPMLILFSIVFVVGFVFAILRWGVPTAAYHIAMHLPESTLNNIGTQSEEYILKLTEPSQLSTARQAQLKQEYLQLIGPDRPAKLIFRQGVSLSANAVALPNNTIIVTDELVALAKDDQEILGVLAHEQGHLNHRHSLQQAISSFGVGIIVMAMSGDISSLLSGLPLAVVDAQFSRHFETDADLYALNQMQQQQIDVMHYAHLLQRLEQEAKDKSEGSDQIVKLLATHPVTADRIKMVTDFKAKQVGLQTKPSNQ